MQLENCTKPVTRELMKKLKFNNLLGLDESLRNGNFKSGKMNGEILETKRLFPHEILMYRYIIVELGLIFFLLLFILSFNSSEIRSPYRTEFLPFESYHCWNVAWK